MCGAILTLAFSAYGGTLENVAVKSKSGSLRAVQATRISIVRAEPALWGRRGAVAGTPPGTTAYSNEVDPQSLFYIPGPSQRMADDILLDSDPCDMVYYDLLVFSQGTASPTFDASTALWDGDPCNADSSIIAGTEAQFADLPALTTNLLVVTLDTPVVIPSSVWLATTFSTDDSGWVVAHEAELGFTGPIWSEDDPLFGCVPLQFVDPSLYEGFWANINCTPIPDPPGACCGGVTCTESIEAECVVAGGTWQGAFTTCTPDPCLPGACCSDNDFTTCRDTTEAGCMGGFEVFRRQTDCAEDPCSPALKVFENSFQTGSFWPIETDTMWGDDLVLATGAPCELVAYNLAVAGQGGGPFDVHMELWTNDDRSTPEDATDDVPLAPISDTAAEFVGIPSDLTTHVLMGGPFEEVTVPDKVWAVLSTTSNLAGPVLGGMADVGYSRDAFAIFNDPNAPGEWSDNFWFGGFNPEGCPGTPPCNPAGSFHIQVWCEAPPPTRACCNDAAGTCIDGVTLAQCDGRWAEGATCESEPFSPVCGTNACCWLGNCQEMSTEFCLALEGDVAYGLLCPDIDCPGSECYDATGDCFSANGTPGCQDGFCCDAVCARDPECCFYEWDALCATEAEEICIAPSPNDHCVDATGITGEGNFSFDTSVATTDGPPHETCGEGDEEQQIFGEVWHCWTASCTDTVYVRTCGLTEVDTRIAVYEGCETCPPVGDDLLSCNDDFCGFEHQAAQSQVSFGAVAGQDYLVRTGTPFGAEGGPGMLNVVCGLPDHPACPGPEECCEGADTPGCIDELCCETICACDAFCCEVAWDDTCAGTGTDNSGCGAEVLCPLVCSEHVGACCRDGTCTRTLATDCTAGDLTYQGDGTFCE